MKTIGIKGEKKKYICGVFPWNSPISVRKGNKVNSMMVEGYEGNKMNGQ